MGSSEKRFRRALGCIYPPTSHYLAALMLFVSSQKISFSVCVLLLVLSRLTLKQNPLLKQPVHNQNNQYIISMLCLTCVYVMCYDHQPLCDIQSGVVTSSYLSAQGRVKRILLCWYSNVHGVP
eukprot:GHVR01110042.1.p1 GENE.GHVR01110042.1~~GHVR01110042.1.p1  ORF type:complete len:123 (+),score=4.53 GHVR01110042.1:871-1239(+)